MKYDSVKTCSNNENKLVITTALQIRHYSRSKKIIDTLNEKGITITNNRALQIETSLANSVINTLKVSPSGIDLFPFLERNKFIHFHFDNTDFTIDSPDGKNQIHGGLIVVFQNGNSSDDTTIPPVDFNTKTDKVNRNEFTELQYCNVPHLERFDIDKKMLSHVCRLRKPQKKCYLRIF